MEKSEIKDILKKYVEYGEKYYFEDITAEKVFKDLGISKERAQEIKDSTEYKSLKESIASLKSIYNGIERRCKEDNIENGFNDFVNFYRWYAKQIENKGNKCHYCGTIESNLKKLFKINDDDTDKPLYSKKTSFTATLQVDRKNSDEDYNEKNCVLACAFCNNAKSDMVKGKGLEFFEKHFKKFVQKFYTHLDSTIKYLD